MNTNTTLNITIDEYAMRRALQLFRAQIHNHAGTVDCLIDLAFSMGANATANAMGTEFTQAQINAITAERERIITTE